MGEKGEGKKEGDKGEGVRIANGPVSMNAGTEIRGFNFLLPFFLISKKQRKYTELVELLHVIVTQKLWG